MRAGVLPFGATPRASRSIQDRAKAGAGDAIVTSRASIQGGVGRRLVRGTGLLLTHALLRDSAEGHVLIIQKPRDRKIRLTNRMQSKERL